MRRLVIPGELITERSVKLGGGVIAEDGGVHASTLGLLDEREGYVRVIPLSGRYNPKEGDFVIGVVSEAQNTYWVLDIRSPYRSILPGSEFHRELRGNERLRDLLPVGSAVYARIKEVTKTKGVFTTLRWRGARVLNEGYLLDVSPSKIPRIIGKKDSMINVLRKEGGCNIIAGHNGVVWIEGSPERTAIIIEAIRYIEENSHRGGLTDHIKEMITQKRSEI